VDIGGEDDGDVLALEHGLEVHGNNVQLVNSEGGGKHRKGSKEKGVNRLLRVLSFQSLAIALCFPQRVGNALVGWELLRA
jgi:hypothetical protein